MRQEQVGKQKSKGMLYYLALFFIWLCFIATPLYLENKYFNFIEAKSHAFVFGSAIILLIALVVVVVKRKEVKATFGKITVIDMMVMVCSGVFVLSALLSSDIERAFTGRNGWCIGALTVFLLSAGYFLVSRFFVYRQNVWIPVVVALSFVFLIAIFHSMNIDVFGLHENILESMIFDYISTIGQKNSFSGFLCLIYPMFAFFFISSEKTFSKVINLILLVPATACLVFTSSDSVFIGLALVAIFGLPYVLKKNARLRKLFLLIAMFGIVTLLVGQLDFFDYKRHFIDGISKAMLGLPISIAFCIGGIVGFALGFVIKKDIPKVPYKALVVFGEALLIGGSLFYIIRSVLSFGPEWGSNRGIIWMESLRVFAENFSFKEKLIGIGPEMLNTVYGSLVQYFGMRVLVAHNEMIQVLLTCGVVGLIAYLGLWGSIFVSFFKHKIWRNDRIALFLPLVAYFGQGIVNSAITTNLAICGVILAIYVGFIRNKLNTEEQCSRHF